MGLLVILFDRELRCEVFQQITMGTPSYGGAGQQSRGMLVPGNYLRIPRYPWKHIETQGGFLCTLIFASAMKYFIHPVSLFMRFYGRYFFRVSMTWFKYEDQGFASRIDDDFYNSKSLYWTKQSVRTQ